MMNGIEDSLAPSARNDSLEKEDVELDSDGNESLEETRKSQMRNLDNNTNDDSEDDSEILGNTDSSNCSEVASILIPEQLGEQEQLTEQPSQQQEQSTSDDGLQSNYSPDGVAEKKMSCTMSADDMLLDFNETTEKINTDETKSFRGVPSEESSTFKDLEEAWRANENAHNLSPANNLLCSSPDDNDSSKLPINNQSDDKRAPANQSASMEMTQEALSDDDSLQLTNPKNENNIILEESNQIQSNATNGKQTGAYRKGDFVEFQEEENEVSIPLENASDHHYRSNPIDIINRSSARNIVFREANEFNTYETLLRSPSFSSTEDSTWIDDTFSDGYKTTFQRRQDFETAGNFQFGSKSKYYPHQTNVYHYKDSGINLQTKILEEIRAISHRISRGLLTNPSPSRSIVNGHSQDHSPPRNCHSVNIERSPQSTYPLRKVFDEDSKAFESILVDSIKARKRSESIRNKVDSGSYHRLRGNEAYQTNSLNESGILSNRSPYLLRFVDRTF